MARTIPPQIEEIPEKGQMRDISETIESLDDLLKTYTDRQGRFVREYLVDWNATQAAIRAGYSKNSAAVIGHELLRNPKISMALDVAKREIAEKVEITPKRVLRELFCMAHYDPFDLADVKCVEDIKKLPELVRRAIIGWGYDKMGNFTLKLSSKDPALDKLGRYLGIFVERKELTGRDGVPLIPPNLRQVDPKKMATEDLEALIEEEEGKK